MKSNLLGMDLPQFRSRLQRRVLLCCCVSVFVLLINILLTLCRTPDNHTLCLWLNIGVDLIASYFLIYEISEYLLPKYRLLRLFSSQGIIFNGTVVQIDGETQRYQSVDCYLLRLDIGCFFLPVNMIPPEVGMHISIRTAANLVLEVTQ